MTETSSVDEPLDALLTAWNAGDAAARAALFAEGAGDVTVFGRPTPVASPRGRRP
ncbi:hypothetical protein [Streptomyces hoynatensis]|uniref:hypothetical protein n=1 Tax=Streptomyces hoynatensis TaxID=1141874 RepID=UPI001319D52C|nr:hypothetical protein [Streptomyces hoynatensis]